MRRLAILHLNSARKYVGEAAHSLELCRILASRGHRVALGARRGYVLERKALDAGVEVLSLGMESRLSLFSDCADARAILGWCRKNDADILHAHRGKDHWLAAGALVLGGNGVPLIRTRHVVTAIHNHCANRWLARRTIRLICVSEAVAASVAESGLYSAPRVATITAGVDLERFAPGSNGVVLRAELGVPPDAPIVAAVARLHPVKGHRYVIEAARRLVDAVPSAQILFVGEGSERDEMERIVAEAGLDDNVHFLGWRDDVPELLRGADLGVLASIGSEGSSRAVMEYMACGLPVIATKVGAVPELVADGESGILVEPRDPEALGDAMARMLSDIPAAREMGRRARETMENSFSPQRWAGRIEELYEDITGGASHAHSPSPAEGTE